MSKDEKNIKTNADGFVTKDELNSFGDKLITTMTGLFKKEIDVHKDTIAQDRTIPSHELGKDMRGIDQVNIHDFVPEAELEDFMNNMLEIYLHPSSNPEDLPVIVPCVNGITQPIIRGKAQRVKRKYVEALARSRHTRYDQQINQFSPDQFNMIPDVAVKDPFTVRNDPHPNGEQWLRAILSEAY